MKGRRTAPAFYHTIIRDEGDINRGKHMEIAEANGIIPRSAGNVSTALY
ncbi:hypothetical protein BAP_1637 [Bacillus sp. CN2]|nr:hypothetical protein BAP_1637 [Bacillus sp. CN2]